MAIATQARVQSLPEEIEKLFREPGAAGEGPTALTTTTNDLGAYRAFWLLPGEYRVVAEGPRLRTYWFARAAPATDGTPVVLREGEEVSNIDIVLRPSADDPVLPNPRR